VSLEPRVQRARRLLASIEKNHSTSALASSFGAEDMVILDLIARDGLAIEIFTIDTGRLPGQTHELIAQVRDRYGLDIDVYTPWPGSVDAYVEENGIDGFYEGVEQRKACCNVRKVEPLRRALAGASAWITGLRAGQSAQRRGVGLVEADGARGLLKLNPLFDWTRDSAAAFAHDHQVPINPLHEQGFLSIGCAPCTRAVRPGEPERAGRWWWEDDAQKECGLHLGGTTR